MNVLSRQVKRLLLSASVLLAFFVFFRPAHAATFTVNSTADDNDGTCVHPFVDAANDCTWREAINASAATGADTVVFDIHSSFPDDGHGQWTINVGSVTNSFPGNTTISAVGVWDADENRPGIKLKRTGGSFTMVTLATGLSNGKVMGLEIEAGATGISTAAAGATLGTDCDGVNDDHERNVIYGTSSESVLVSNATGVKIQGNYIGVRNDGVTASTFGTYGIRITGANGDSAIVGYQGGSTCSAAQQRNIIGGGDGVSDYGIWIGSVATTSLTGDSTAAPHGNRISGNYIGIGSDGVTDVGGVGNGVGVANAATLNIIGTDGDGLNDASEGNVIGGWSVYNVHIDQTGYNRISGNAIGFAADGTTNRGSGSHGVLLRGTGNIVGWCDATVHATLCSDGGSVFTQGNIVGFSGASGVRPGADCDDCKIFGNIIGTDAAQVIDAGNTSNGVFVHRGNENTLIGGSTNNHRNIIRNNGLDGVHVDGYFSGTPFTSGPTEGYVIQNNRISGNGQYGVHLLGTEQDGNASTPDGTVTGNTIEANGVGGILLEGSSPSVTENIVANNEGYAIRVISSYRHDEPSDTAMVYNNAYDALSPSNEASDAVAAPSFSGNTIDGNSLGGIYILDAAPANQSSLSSDNSIGINGVFDVRVDRYVVGRVHLADGTDVSSNVLLTFTPANGLVCTSTCTTEAVASTGVGTTVHGPEGVLYNNASTWMKLTVSEVSTGGNTLSYNPYTLSTSSNFRVEGDNQVTVGTGRYEAVTVTVANDGSNATAESFGVRAPIAGVPIPIQGGIRWTFEDQAANESGYRIVKISNGIETVVAHSGEDAVAELSLLEEYGLTPGEEYCDRFVVAYSGAGTSLPAPLPCAIAGGEVVPNEASPSSMLSGDSADLILQQHMSILRVYRDWIDGIFGGTSLPLSSGAMFLLWKNKKHALKRVKGPAIHWHRRTVLALVCVVIAVLATTYARNCVAACEQLTQVHQHDIVRVEFVLSNAGPADARGTYFSTTVPEGLRLIESSPRFELDWLYGGFTFEDGVLATGLPILPAGQRIVISYTAEVEAFNGFIISEAVVHAENAITAPANTITVRVENDE